MTAGSHIATLVVGRLLLGVCTGLITGTAPVFASEIAKTEERGRISYVTCLVASRELPTDTAFAELLNN